MSLDRSQPFEEVEEPPVQGFDRSKPFEDTDTNFDPAAVLIDPRRASQHATEQGKSAISMLMDTQPDEESKARSVNQVYLKPRVSYLPQRVMMENWPAVRDGYAKSLGYTQGSVSEQQFTELLRKEAETDKKALWSSAGPMDRIKLMFGEHGISDPELKVEHAVPMIGSEAAGTKGGAFTIPKMEGTGTLVGVINAANKFTAMMTTPENAGIALATSGAGLVAELLPLTRAAVVARATQAATLGTFTAIGAKDTVNAVAEAKLKMNDPKATDAERAEAIATVVFSAAMTAAAAYGTYDFAGVAKTAAESVNPAAQRAESINLLREQAAQSDAKTAKTLNQVADEIQALPPVVEKAEPAKPGEAVVEDLDGGGFSVTDKDGNRVYTQERAEADALAKDLGAKAEAKGNERAEYDQLQKEMADMGYDKAGTPAFNELWQKSEDIKNRNEGMPPEKPAETPVKEPDILQQAKTPEAVQESVKTAKEAVVGIKNASVDEALAKMGMDPATHGEKLSFEEARQDAASKMEKDPLAGQKLIAQLEAEPRPVTGKENALLLHELTRLTNERAAAETALIEATKMGDPLGVADAKLRVEQATRDYVKAADIDTKVGTANAIGLSLRRMMMKEDYSLAAMERRRQVANEGKPLSEAQRAEVVQMHKDIAAKEQAMIDAKERKTPKKEKGIVLKFINEQAEAARARIAERLLKAGGKSLVEGENIGGLLSKENMSDLATVGAEYIAKGATKLAEWSEQMVKEFGESIKPHLKAIYDRAISVSEEAKISAELSAKKERIAKEIQRIEAKIKGGGVEPESRGAKRPSIKEIEVLEQRRDLIKQELSGIQKTNRTIEELQAAIKEKTEQIASGDVEPKGPNAFRPSRREIEVLRQERDALNEQIAEMRKRPVPTPEETRLKRIEGQIAEIERQIDSGEIFPKGKKPSVNSPEITKALDKLEALKYERENLREAIQPSAEPKTSQEKRLSVFKGQRERATEELNRRIKEGDFEKKAKPEELHLDEEANRLQAEYDIAKLEYDRLLERDRFENLSPLQKVGENALVGWDSSRAILAGFEFSVVGRQGAGRLFYHPIKTIQSLGDAFKALVSNEEGAHAINLKTLNDPAAVEARANKLALIDEKASLSKQEEIYMGKLVGKIPGVKNFERFAHVFLNKIRLDMWKEERAAFPDASPRLTADFINSVTGRGSLGALERNAVLLNRAIFSPRFLASRVQMGSGYYLWKAALSGDAAAVKMVSKNYARTMIGYSVFLSALYYGFKAYTDEPVSIGLIPNSSEFMKLKVGKTRIDLAAGVQQPLVFLNRLATGEMTTAKGKETKVQGGQVERFARSKLNPSASKIYDITPGLGGGKNAVGEPVVFTDLLYPATYGDIKDAFEEHDIPEATLISILGLFGAGISTYDENAKRGSSTPPPRK